MKGRIGMFVAVCVGLTLLTPFADGLPSGDRADFVFWQLRLPRLLVAIMAGGVMGMTGAAYQTVFRNGLAAPGTTGTTAGASLGALIAVVGGATWGPSAGGLPLIAAFAFVGAMSASLFVAALAASGRARINDVLLAGIGVSLASGALATGIQFTADESALFRAVQWSLGHISQVGYKGVAVMAPFCVACVVLLWTQVRGLQALASGEELAHSRGLDVAKVRALTLGAGAIGVAAVVAWCGPIAFIGLVAPHLVRPILGVQRRVLIPMSAICGGAFLAISDGVARLISPERELPAGVITAAIGAPLLLFLILKQAKRD